MKRIRLKILGQSGSGLLTIGDIFSKALKSLGFQLCSDREYPSLIKGGYSCYTINFGNVPIQALSRISDVTIAIDKQSLMAYYQDLDSKSVLIQSFEISERIKDVFDFIKSKNIKTTHIPCTEIAKENNGNKMMTNIILLGVLSKTFGIDYTVIEKLVKTKFEKKKNIFETVMNCLRAGYEYGKTELKIEIPKKKNDTKLLDGNYAIALGAIHCGVRFYSAYPMSPASSILSHLAKLVPQTKMIVKQVEDEITAAQMVLGAMTVGTRAFTATSGGGFDLMTETLSLSGIIESPFVVVIAQRPGPGTGLPTWTGQGDLNLAINSGHGEFPRVVISISNPIDGFELIQQAFNLAEKYQVPVLVLTEKNVCESKMTIKPLAQNTIPIERGLISDKELKTIKNSDRYKITESGVSQRWLPGSTDTYYFANGDEHWEGGELEEGERAGEMYAKRMRKLGTIQKDLPEPILYGPEIADISFIGWGSSANIMHDVINVYKEKNIKVNYLHYEYVWPLKTKKALNFFKKNKNVHLIEGNYQGQLGEKIEGKTGQKFVGKLLKWNGRAFFLEDLEQYIRENLKLKIKN